MLYPPSSTGTRTAIARPCNLRKCPSQASRIFSYRPNYENHRKHPHCENPALGTAASGCGPICNKTLCNTLPKRRPGASWHGNSHRTKRTTAFHISDHLDHAAAESKGGSSRCCQSGNTDSPVKAEIGKQSVTMIRKAGVPAYSACSRRNHKSRLSGCPACRQWVPLDRYFRFVCDAAPNTTHEYCRRSHHFHDKTQYSDRWSQPFLILV